MYESDASPSTIHGHGSEEDPYRIYYLEQLDRLFTAENFLNDGHYRLMRDIAYNGVFTPIGASLAGMEYYGFTGIFDGNHKTISGLILDKVMTEYETYWGFFVSIGTQALIQNLSLTELSFLGNFETNTNYMGGIVGKIQGQGSRIVNCHVTAEIEIASDLDQINNSRVDINSIFFGNVYIGFIAAASDVFLYNDPAIEFSIQDSSVQGSIVLPSFYRYREIVIGGIVGKSGYYRARSTIQNCQSDVEIDVVFDLETSRFSLSFVNLGGIIGDSANLLVQDIVTTSSIRVVFEVSIEDRHVFVGGIAGSSSKTEAIHCTVETFIDVSSSWLEESKYGKIMVGGAFGSMHGNVTDVHVIEGSQLLVQANTYASIGGLIGNYSHSALRYDSEIRESSANTDTLVYQNETRDYHNDIIYGGFIGTVTFSQGINPIELRIVDSHSMGKLETMNERVSRAGGFIGTSSFLIIETCSSTVDLVADIGYAGGFASTISGNISNSFATGDVTANYGAGGFVYYFQGIIVNFTQTTGTNGTISNCYATGNVSSINEPGASRMGGFVGTNSNIIIDSYATGNVYAANYRPTQDSYGNADCYAGGFAAFNGTFGQIINSYATGSVSGFSLSGTVHTDSFIVKDSSQ
jgi:hypothetical protein